MAWTWGTAGWVALALIVGCGDDGSGDSGSTTATATTSASGTSGTGESTSTGAPSLEELIDAYFTAIEGYETALCKCYETSGSRTFDDCMAGALVEYPQAMRDCHRQSFIDNPSAELEVFLGCWATFQGELAGCLEAADCSDADAARVSCAGQVDLPGCSLPDEVLAANEGCTP